MQTSTSSHIHTRSPDDFDLWADAIRRHVSKRTGPFFYTVPTKPLFETYLDTFTTPASRQLHNCHCCRHFLERFGNIVTIEDDEVTPLFWDTMPVPGYEATQQALHNAVSRAPIGGVYLSSDKTWGSGPSAPKMWTHFQAKNPAVFKNTILQNASQAMALKLEEKGMLDRALGDFSLDIAKQAVAILNTDQLYRSEKVLGVAEWFLKLREELAQNKNWKRHSLVMWQTVAAAPVGFVHVRSSMIGTLLDDLKSGLPFATVQSRFAEKMHPLAYRRPTAAPSEGQIAQAEKVVEALQAAGSLERRFAKLEDLVTCWKPAPIKAKESTNGVFDHLRSKKVDAPIATGAPATTITWEKFARTVLPTAENIEAMVPYSGAFIAFVAPVNPNSEIVQWANQVTWYQYVGGSPASSWNLKHGFHPVTAISLNPAHWDPESKMTHQNKMAVLVLEGAKDMRHTAGGGLFVELLKSEYNGIRHTLEAHFRKSKIVDRDEGSACGLAYEGSTVRVTSNGVQTLYKMDRWD